MYFFFFFPVGTDSKRGSPPVGTAILLVTALLMFGVRYLSPSLYFDLVAASFRPSDPALSRAFLSLFLHGGWSHLLGNALYLWIFGKQFEGRLGFVPLSAVYFGGGIAACYAQALMTPETSWNWNMPVVGASGAVAALMGATVVRFYFQRVRVLYFLFAFLGGMTRGGVVHVNAVIACTFWFAFQIIYGLVAWGNGGAGVAYAAHAGGFLAGVAIAMLLGLPRGAKRDLHEARGKRYFEAGDWYAAAGELTAHLRLSPGDLPARAMRARCRILLGRTGEAAAEYLTLFREARVRGEILEIARLYREIRRYGIATNLNEAGLLKLAFRFRKAGRSEAAAEAFLEILTNFPADPKAELAWIRRAEILWDDLGRAGEAQETYRRFLAEFPDSEWRDVAEARLGTMKAHTHGPARARSRPGTPASGRASERAPRKAISRDGERRG